jgi:hypothetical protein
MSSTVIPNPTQWLHFGFLRFEMSYLALRHICAHHKGDGRKFMM